jgi:hypothetical protein
MAESKTSRRRIEARQRVTRALEMRKRGVTYADIAAACGYNSPQAAAKAVRTELRRMPEEAREELRQIEMARLDALLAAVWPKAMVGDVAATRAALDVCERRARLLGLDAPTKVAQTDAQGRDMPAIEILRERLVRLIEEHGATGEALEQPQPV